MRKPIRELRKALGLSQAELAARVGTTQVTVSGWERGNHVPSGENLRKLAEALDTPQGDIAYGGELSDMGRAEVREVLQGALESTNPGVWRTEAGLFVRPHFAPVDRLLVGMRHHFDEYVSHEAVLKVMPVGTHRKGVREVAVYAFPGPDFPA